MEAGGWFHCELSRLVRIFNILEFLINAFNFCFIELHQCYFSGAWENPRNYSWFLAHRVIKQMEGNEHEYGDIMILEDNRPHLTGCSSRPRRTS